MAEFWRSTVLPHVEARRSCQENACYRPHAHDSFSIGGIDAGASVLSGALEGTILLEAGDVVVIPASQVHACNPHAGRWRYQMIHLEQDWAASFAACLEASHLFDGLRVLRRPGLHAHLTELSEAIFADGPLDLLESRFARLFGELATAATAHPVTREANSELLARLGPVMDRLRTDRSNPALDDLAESVGMSKFQLVRAMRQATGLSPLAWRQNARIIEARRMLRDGRPITETAYALGFTDQSHFHRIFRAHVAASPGRYQG